MFNVVLGYSLHLIIILRNWFSKCYCSYDSFSKQSYFRDVPGDQTSEKLLLKILKLKFKKQNKTNENKTTRVWNLTWWPIVKWKKKWIVLKMANHRANILKCGTLRQHIEAPLTLYSLSLLVIQCNYIKTACNWKWTCARAKWSALWG